MKWLHISDLHFPFENYDTIELRSKMISFLSTNEIKLDFIVITGDLLYRYDFHNEIIKFISDIQEACEVKSNKVFLVPGNHDINRNDNKRNILIDEIRKRENLTVKRDELDDLLTLGHEKFMNVAKKINSSVYDDYKNFDVFNIGDSVRLIAIDTTLLSKDNYDEGNLSVRNLGLQSIGKDIKNDSRLNIVFMHHSMSMLSSRLPQIMRMKVMLA